MKVQMLSSTTLGTDASQVFDYYILPVVTPVFTCVVHISIVERCLSLPKVFRMAISTHVYLVGDFLEQPYALEHLRR